MIYEYAFDGYIHDTVLTQHSAMVIISGALCYSGHYVRLGSIVTHSYHDLNRRAGRLHIGLIPFVMTYMMSSRRKSYRSHHHDVVLTTTKPPR